MSLNCKKKFDSSTLSEWEYNLYCFLFIIAVHRPDDDSESKICSHT